MQGMVVLKLWVLPSGRVDWVRVERSVNPLLDNAALDASCFWHFRPTSDSFPRSSCAVIHFSLEAPVGTREVPALSSTFVPPYYLRVTAEPVPRDPSP